MEEMKINSLALVPQVSFNETQMIFQRHCAYNDGGLSEESVNYQKKVVNTFLDSMDSDLENTYFLFTASNTISGDNFKRCVETTNIAMELVRDFYEEKGVSVDHVMNFNNQSNYNSSVHESRHLTEPGMFNDGTGYLEFLKEKNGGMNLDFWIDFEEDLSKQKREQFGSEGPDEIVQRGIHYINILERYAEFFHMKYLNSKLIIWNGTHYDLISPLVKQRVLNCEKSDCVGVENCGGISLIVDESSNIMANVNGTLYPFDSQYKKPLQQHF